MYMEGVEGNKDIIRKRSPEILETLNPREGVTVYVFDGLAIAIDASGKNYEPLPELLFGPYNKETGKGSFSQPKEQEEGMDMNYMTICLQQVVRVTSLRKFWFDAYKDDAVKEKYRERRARARMKLFQIAGGDIEPAPEGYGFILSLPE